jgi:hypothetical protein
VKVKDGLPCPGPDVHDDPVVLEAGNLCRLGNELEHPLRLVRREGADIAKGVDVPLRQHEKVGVGLRVDVANGDESVRCMDVVALAN